MLLFFFCQGHLKDLSDPNDDLRGGGSRGSRGSFALATEADAPDGE